MRRFSLQEFETHFKEWVESTNSREDKCFDKSVREYLGEELYDKASDNGLIADTLLQKLTGELL